MPKYLVLYGDMANEGYEICDSPEEAKKAIEQFLDLGEDLDDVAVFTVTGKVNLKKEVEFSDVVSL